MDWVAIVLRIKTVSGEFQKKGVSKDKASGMTYNSSPFTFAKGVTRLTLPVACTATAWSCCPLRRASRKAEQSQSQDLQTFIRLSFFIL
jgi:hypothetical protein